MPRSRKPRKDLAERVIAAAVAEETAALQAENKLLREALRKVLGIVSGVSLDAAAPKPVEKKALPPELAALNAAADEEAALLDPRNDDLAPGDNMGPGRWVP